MDIHDAPAPTSAFSRFLEVAELRQLVLNHLLPERADLLPLASTSKTVRALVLPTWVRQLDLRVSAARRLLRFFRAHPALLGNIRFLRVRSDVHEASGMYGGPISSRGLPQAYWDDLNTLLRMIADAATWRNGQPLVDLTMAYTDPIELPLPLKQRVVALRVIPEESEHSTRQLSRAQQNNADAEGPSAPAAGAEAALGASSTTTGPAWDTEQHIPDVEMFVAEASTPVPHSDAIARLFDIIHLAADGPGLRTLHLYHCPDLNSDLPVIEGLAEKVHLLHANSLRDLSMRRTQSFLPYVLLEGTYPHLEHFHHVIDHVEDVAHVEAFLDRHSASLRTLEVETASPDVSLSHRQTFPRLRWLMTPDPFAPDDFAARHPEVVGNPRKLVQFTFPVITFGPPPNVRFPKLRFEPLWDPDALRVMLEANVWPSYLYISCMRYDMASAVSFFEVLLAHPDAARRVSCLEIQGSCGLEHWTEELKALLQTHEEEGPAPPEQGARQEQAAQPSEDQTMEESTDQAQPQQQRQFEEDRRPQRQAPAQPRQLLPGLTELTLLTENIEGGGRRRRPRTRAQDERELGRLLRDLVPLSALKALHIEGPRADFETDELFVGHTGGADDGAGAGAGAGAGEGEGEGEGGEAIEFPPALEYLRWRDQHFRFVSPDPHGRTVLDGPHGGKYGRLRYIPATFRTRVTPQGVWERSFDPVRESTIYDHLG